MQDLLFQIARDGTVLEFRGELVSDLLDPLGEAVGRNIRDLLPSSLAGQIMRAIGVVLETGDVQTVEYQSESVPSNLYEAKIVAGGEDRVTAIISNVTAYKEALTKVRHLAYHDSLTDLPNRVLFHDRLQQAIAYAERNDLQIAVLFLDLDNFKQINDTLGHRAGDRLLQAVAERLTRAVRRTDSIARLAADETELLVARLGGDEFTILLTDIANIQDPAKVCHRILQQLTEPFPLGVQEVFITCSIGIAVYPVDGKDMDLLLSHADAAMYQAKDHGRNTYRYYSESLNKFTLERLTVENKLRRALEQNEFMLFYQPQIDIVTGRMIGVEALIRWLQPDLVLVKPGQFIPLAEETGLILPMGEWILRTACAQNMEWQKIGLPPMKMTINVSSIQFRQDDFIERLSMILKETGLDPKYLQLELTESAVMRDTSQSIRKLHDLQSMGVQISIDDFGTGYSSLNYLKRFPISTLKIDISFIKEVMTSAVDQSIVNAIVTLGHNFNLTVIAEGVETGKQLAFLRDCGCEGAQGFLFCPPVNSDLLSQFVKTERHREVLKMIRPKG